MTTAYTVIFETEDSGAISAYVPGLPVYAAADTRAKAERAMHDLLAAYFEDLSKQGLAAPKNRAEVKVARVERFRTKPARIVLVGSAALVGRRTSKTKAAAARANGAKGGRPRKAASAR